MRPTIASIVHYTDHGRHQAAPWVTMAAIVTSIPADDNADGTTTNLTIFGDATAWSGSGATQAPRVPYSETPKPGHWSWPPR